VRLDFAGRSGDPESVTFGQESVSYAAYSNGDAISTPLESVPVISIDNTGPKPVAESLKLRSPADFQKFIGGEFRSEIPGNSYRYSVSSGAIRVFVDGAAYGVSGHVETFGLKPGYAHIVMYKEGEVADAVKAWCQLHADTRVDVRSLVPAYFTSSPFWKVFVVRANVPACEDGRSNSLKYEIRPLARFAGGLRLYRRGNKYLVAMPPVVNLVSRHPVTCSINDGPEFIVEGFTLNLQGRLAPGTSKLVLKEQAQDGQQSELNLTLIEVAEWVGAGAGNAQTLNEPPRKAVDGFKGVLGCWRAAYSNDADDCSDMKASWQNVEGDYLIPCVSAPLLAERVQGMTDVRHGAYTIGRHNAWRAVIDRGRLHPAFSNPGLKMVWDNFVKKSR
jgi:hypothetical protein